MRSSMKIVAVTAVTLLAGCNVIKGKETAGQGVDDATIATRAKAALVKDDTVSASDFNIDVYKGNVTLTGVANNPDEVKRAIDDIKRVLRRGGRQECHPRSPLPIAGTRASPSSALKTFRHVTRQFVCMSKKLPRSFYAREDTLRIARELIGMHLVHDDAGEGASAAS